MSAFTPARRAGAGSPLVCLHGFMETWRTWELVLPALERRHDVLAPTLPGHAGGPPLPPGAGLEELLDLVDDQLDAAGLDVVHLVGSSLGGYLALRLAERGRARTVVALAPAGGWRQNGDSAGVLLRQRALHAQLRAAAPHADALVRTAAGRRRATALVTRRFEHIPPQLLAHQLVAAARCEGADEMVRTALGEGWSLDAARVTCPVRIVWGAADELLPWPAAAGRLYDRLPHADWVVLDDVGHCPQLDVPLETAQLILGFTSG